MESKIAYRVPENMTMLTTAIGESSETSFTTTPFGEMFLTTVEYAQPVPVPAQIVSGEKRSGPAQRGPERSAAQSRGWRMNRLSGTGGMVATEDIPFIYRALGIPTQMFTVMFALGRLPGWIAHWKEMIEDPNTKIGRPRQIYTGPTENHYKPIEQRGESS